LPVAPIRFETERRWLDCIGAKQAAGVCKGWLARTSSIVSRPRRGIWQPSMLHFRARGFAEGIREPLEINGTQSKTGAKRLRVDLGLCR
jgi:hypothetical protein